MPPQNPASPVQQIPTTHDAQATRDLRAKILNSDPLSQDLANAIADVFQKHGIVHGPDQLVSLEPVVTRTAPAGLTNLVAGSNLQAASHDLSAAVHVVETRGIARNFAVTASAWM
jgi:hypothetical protein